MGAIMCDPQTPRVGYECCEHAPSLTLCALVILNYLQVLGVARLSVWACVAGSERNASICQSPHQANSYRTCRTQVRCHLFLEVFLVPSTTPSPRLD